MKKIQKLKVCNWSLVILAVAIMLSGLQLEVTDSSGFTSVWIHIIIGVLFMVMVFYHLFLHYGFSNWYSRILKQKSHVTRILWWISLLSLITGVVACVHWLGTFSHSHIGGVHGKLGFMMIILSIGHIVKRISFFKNKKRTVPSSVGGAIR